MKIFKRIINGQLFEESNVSEALISHPMVKMAWTTPITIQAYVNNIGTYLIWLAMDYACLNLGAITVNLLMGNIGQFICKTLLLDYFQMQ